MVCSFGGRQPVGSCPVMLINLSSDLVAGCISVVCPGSDGVRVHTMVTLLPVVRSNHHWLALSFVMQASAMCNVHIVHDPAMPSVLMCNIYQELYSVLAVSSLPHSAPLKSAWRAWLEPGSKISMNKSSKIDRRRQHHHQHHTTTPGTTSNARYCAM